MHTEVDLEKTGVVFQSIGHRFGAVVADIVSYTQKRGVKIELYMDECLAYIKYGSR